MARSRLAPSGDWLLCTRMAQTRAGFLAVGVGRFSGRAAVLLPVWTLGWCPVGGVGVRLGCALLCFVVCWLLCWVLCCTMSWQLHWLLFVCCFCGLDVLVLGVEFVSCATFRHAFRHVTPPHLARSLGSWMQACHAWHRSRRSRRPATDQQLAFDHLGGMQQGGLPPRLCRASLSTQHKPV